MGDPAWRDNRCEVEGDNSGEDRCDSVALDDSGNIYCAGYTDGALGEPNGGDKDAFILKLTSDGELF